MLTEVQNQMILDNVKLITYMIKKMNLMKNYEEFYEIGLFGLIDGVKHYNPDFGIKQSTFLAKCIESKILMEFRRRKSDIRKANYNAISLDKEIEVDKFGKAITLNDIIASEFNLEDEVIRNDDLNLIINKMSILSDKERFVINHTYELNNCKKLSQKEIGNVLNVPQGTISRIKNRAIKKIRKEIEI